MTGAPRILIHNSETRELAARLAETAPDAEIATCDSYEGLPGIMQSFDPDVAYGVCFQGRQNFPREAFLGPHGPDWIAVGGSGVDHLGSWDPEAVTVTNAAGSASAMMAEYAFGAMMHFTLDVPGLIADKAARRWDGGRMVRPLKGATLLIVGLGNTGRAVAARAQAFGMHVIGTRARPCEMDDVDEVHASEALPELWGRADFIVLSVPLLPGTRGLVDAAAFEAMKPEAILVDVSRGGVVDGAALTRAMQRGMIAGAALDVFDPEPLPEDSPIWALENVIVSPHCSAVFDGWTQVSFDIFLDNLARWRDGAPLRNVVSPERGY